MKISTRPLTLSHNTVTIWLRYFTSHNDDMVILLNGNDDNNKGKLLK